MSCLDTCCLQELVLINTLRDSRRACSKAWHKTSIGMAIKFSAATDNVDSPSLDSRSRQGAQRASASYMLLYIFKAIPVYYLCGACTVSCQCASLSKCIKNWILLLGSDENRYVMPSQDPERSCHDRQSPPLHCRWVTKYLPSWQGLTKQKSDTGLLKAFI